MENLDATPSESYLEEALQDAERLLKYAAEVGVDVEPGVRHDIVQARTFSGGVWNDGAATNLLTALTALAAKLKPVTAESLKACRDEPRHTVRTYLDGPSASRWSSS